MREQPKYRFWDKDIKKIRHPIGDLRIDSCWCWAFDEKSFIPMQFTGLKDKNNKEIYEGDICQFPNWKPKEIIWRDGRYMLGNTLVICCKIECNEMEIIGNIYENPELLNA